MTIPKLIKWAKREAVAAKKRAKKERYGSEYRAFWNGHCMAYCEIVDELRKSQGVRPSDEKA